MSFPLYVYFEREEELLHVLEVRQLDGERPLGSQGTAGGAGFGVAPLGLWRLFRGRKSAETRDRRGRRGGGRARAGRRRRGGGGRRRRALRHRRGGRRRRGDDRGPPDVAGHLRAERLE